MLNLIDNGGRESNRVLVDCLSAWMQIRCQEQASALHFIAEMYFPVLVNE